MMQIESDNHFISFIVGEREYNIGEISWRKREKELLIELYK